MHALLTRLPEAHPVRSSAPADWRVTVRLLAGAALFGAIIGSIGCSSSSNPAASRGSAVVTIRVVGEKYPAREGAAFGSGRYRPWAAEVVRIEVTP
jgi:hypothetical protein